MTDITPLINQITEAYASLGADLNTALAQNNGLIADNTRLSAENASLKARVAELEAKPAPPAEPPPSDAIPVGPSHALKTLADIEANQQEGKTYLLDPITFGYDGSRGVALKAKNAVLKGQPGTVITHTGDGIRHGYPAGVEVYGQGNIIEGIEFAGPRKTRGVEIKSGSSDTLIINCTGSTVDGKANIGQLVQIERGVNVHIVENKTPRLRRYGVYVDHCDKLTLKRNHFGPSDGADEPKYINGVKNPLWFDQESNVRFYDTHHALIEGNTFEEREKDGIVFRQGSDIDILNNTMHRARIGPLADGDGKVDDPTMRVNDVRFKGNHLSDLDLEMGADNVLIEGNIFTTTGTVIDCEYDAAYASTRQVASGTVGGNTIRDGAKLLGGRSERMVVE